MKVVAIIAGILVLLGRMGCKHQEMLWRPTEDVDPKIIGDWYTFDTMAVSHPSPNIACEGMRIAQTGTITSLGIETETGRVVSLDGLTKTLLRAKEGVLIMEYLAPPIPVVDTMHYDVESSSLTLTRNQRSINYYRTRVGAKVTELIHSTLTVDIDGVLRHNTGVGVLPLTYFSTPNEHSFILQAHVTGASITIEVDSFHGIGTYNIKPNRGIFRYDGVGDVMGFTFETDSLSDGTITIGEYDRQASCCSGTFEFTGRFSDETVKLRKGQFSVPVYK